VPQLAVQQGSNGHLVYVVKEDGTAEVRPAVVGDYYGEKEIVIVSGLRAGDRVVVDGALKVVPGQQVTIVEPGAAPQKGAPGAAPAGKGDTAPKGNADAKSRSSEAPAGSRGAVASLLPARIQFPFRSAALDEKGRQTIAGVAAELKGARGIVLVTGYSDGRGTPERNRRFAEDRARAVGDALAANGVPGERIRLVKPARAVGDGSREEARRVEIALSAGRAD
jgi:outer membrane protein OmpA-like peptidoglycan-associated protein